jgi:hypothetical protein
MATYEAKMRSKLEMKCPCPKKSHAIEPLVSFPDPIIYDVPRTAENFVNYGVLEQVKNGLFFSSKYESEMAVFNPPHVIW